MFDSEIMIIYGFKLHFACNEKGEIITSFFSPGNTDDRNEQIFDVLKKKLFGKLYADKGYISASLFNNGEIEILKRNSG